MSHEELKKMNRVLKRSIKKWGALSIFLGLNLLGFNNCARGFFTTVDGQGDFSSLGMADEAFTCNVNAPPIADNVLRLTGRQYQNTLKTIIAYGLTAADAPNLATFFASNSVSSIISSFPNEGFYGKGNGLVYDTADQRITLLLDPEQIAAMPEYKEKGAPILVVTPATPP